TDELGLPLSPSWSVHALISSYPSPRLTSATVTQLHKIAALIPPEEDTADFKELKAEMEDLVRLVEAVRMAPNDVNKADGPSDGIVRSQDKEVELRGARNEIDGSPPFGRELLKHTRRTEDGYYLVDSSRSK
ncbi:hypothetical protein K439DRAFT_1258801, partial [Ramaria rubella]